MNKASTLPIIAHTYGEKITARIREQYPDAVIQELPDQAWRAVPNDQFVLLCSSGRYWKDAPTQAPAGWSEKLQWVQVPAAGIDVYPEWLRRAPRLTASRGLAATPVAEFVLANMLAHEKKFPETWIKQRSDWRPMALGTLAGKTLGVAGYGAIGQKIVSMALAFDMQVMVLRQSSAPLPEGIARASNIAELAKAADHLVIALPSAADTHRMIDNAVLQAMKPGSHLINVSRGDVIDQVALLQALDHGPLLAASLDVTDPEPLPAEHPLYAHPRVRISPHTAFSNPHSITRVVDRFMHNMACYLSDQPMLDELTWDGLPVKIT